MSSIEQHPEVKTARAAVHRSLNQFEHNMSELANKIEMTNVVAVGWPILKTTWHTFRFIRKNPWMLAAAGSVAGGIWLYKRLYKPTSARSE